ncbi:MAG TPA: glycosyltransferase family 87 protein [Candidatus Limnocylindrales bacterium]
MALDVYGLRLLARPRVQRLALGVFLGVVLLYRLLQVVAFSNQVQWGYDFSFYWAAAIQLLHGLPIYSAAQLAGPYAPQGQEGFLYPPPFAAALTPFAAVLPGDARLINWLWFGLGLVLLVGAVLAIARTERLGERFALLRGRGAWWLVAAALALPPVVAELVLGNVNLEILALLSAAWLGIRRDTRKGELVAGAAIGAAALIKVFPGLLILWLLVTRRWWAAAASIGAILVLALVTLPITGVQPWLDYPTVLLNLGAPSDTTDTLAPTVWLTPILGYGLARMVVTIIGLAIVVAMALRVGTGARAGLGARGSVVAASFGAAVATSVLVAPAVYQHYLAILVLPLLLAVVAGARLRWLAIAYLLMWGGEQAALGDYAWILNKGLPTLGAVLLLGLLVLAAWIAGGPRRLAATTAPAG